MTEKKSCQTRRASSSGRGRAWRYNRQ
jgi:hypothetical protein